MSCFATIPLLLRALKIAEIAILLLTDYKIILQISPFRKFSTALRKNHQMGWSLVVLVSTGLWRSIEVGLRTGS